MSVFAQNFIVYLSGIPSPASKDLYEQANEFVEKWTKIIHFFLSEIASQIIIGGFAVLSYVLYFVADFKEESFYLPSVIWYVF